MLLVLFVWCGTLQVILPGNLDIYMTHPMRWLFIVWIGLSSVFQGCVTVCAAGCFI